MENCAVCLSDNFIKHQIKNNNKWKQFETVLRNHTNECWDLIFDNELLNIIVESTNLYVGKNRSNFNRESEKPTDLI